MTNLATNTDRPAPAVLRDEACAAAQAAAVASGVEIRELAEIADLAAMVGLFESIWRSGPGGRAVSTELLRAMSAAGNYVAGAFAGGDLLGACFGFFGSPAKASLHSHIAGVATEGAGRGIGYALKLHQRGWALLRDVSVITWTFDPLVARNAYFNLGKLGARPVCYLRDFYGPMEDELNGPGDTDRLMVDWDLRSPEVRAAAFGHPVLIDAEALGAVNALTVGPDGGPSIGSTDGPTVLVTVPSDIERLRRTDPGRDHAWRVALREVLGALMADNAHVAGFDRAGWYVISKEQS